MGSIEEEMKYIGGLFLLIYKNPSSDLCDKLFVGVTISLLCG